MVEAMAREKPQRSAANSGPSTREITFRKLSVRVGRNLGSSPDID
jgi:hypothetical protein